MLLSLGLAVVLAGTVGVVSLLSRPQTRAVVSSGPATSSAPTSAATTPSSPSSATAAPPTSQPTKAAPSPTRSPSTEPEPKTPNTSMKKNTIYSINLSGSAKCNAKIRRPKPPLKNSKLAPYLRTVVDCLVDAFRAPLEKEGFELTTPKVKTFKKSVKTPCGTLRSNSNPAFYCAGTIYWPVSSDDGREAYTFARMGYVGLTAHEFGHHLQAVTGLLYGYGYQYNEASTKARYTLSRRLELQAQCFEGVFLAQSKKSIKLSSRDKSEIRTWHSYTGDEDPPSSRKPDHGTSKAQVRWLERGLDGADFGRCNTWSASKSAVK
ncbi:MAG: neutral zinc metallopeptidase [Propionibacteriaceae bacterium]